jgi:hypothetical protein
MIEVIPLKYGTAIVTLAGLPEKEVITISNRLKNKKSP